MTASRVPVLGVCATLWMAPGANAAGAHSMTGTVRCEAVDVTA